MANFDLDVLQHHHETMWDYIVSVLKKNPTQSIYSIKKEYIKSIPQYLQTDVGEYNYCFACMAFGEDCSKCPICINNKNIPCTDEDGIFYKILQLRNKEDKKQKIDLSLTMKKLWKKEEV